MVSKFQWKPFWLVTQRDPQNDWTATQNGVNYDVFAQAPFTRSDRSIFKTDLHKSRKSTYQRYAPVAQGWEMGHRSPEMVKFFFWRIMLFNFYPIVLLMQQFAKTSRNANCFCPLFLSTPMPKLYSECEGQCPYVIQHCHAVGVGALQTFGALRSSSASLGVFLCHCPAAVGCCVTADGFTSRSYSAGHTCNRTALPGKESSDISCCCCCCCCCCCIYLF